MSEYALAFGWIASVLNGDATIQALPGYDTTISPVTGQANGIVWDTVGPELITRPIFLISALGGSDQNIAGNRRLFSGLMVLVKAVGESKDYTTIDTMAGRADVLLSPRWPTNSSGQAYPVDLGTAWVLTCERTMPHQLTYPDASKVYTELGGFYAPDVRIK